MRRKPEVATDTVYRIAEAREEGHPIGDLDLALGADGHLRTNSRASAVIYRAIGEGLRRLRDMNGFEKLGYIRPGDYTRERLGLEPGHAGDLERLARRLLKLPELDRAYQEGRFDYAHVREIARHILPEEDAVFANRLAPMPVDRLQVCLRWWVKNREAIWEGRLDDCTPLEEEEDVVPETTFPDPEDRRPEGRWVECTISSELEEKLEVAHELASRLDGRKLSKADAISLFIGEFLSGEGGTVLSEAPEPTEEEKARERERRCRLAMEAEARREHREAKKTISEINDCWAHLSWTIQNARLPESLKLPDNASPGQLDAWLRKLTKLLQRVSVHLMEWLAILLRKKLYQELEFVDFGQYATERLGMSESLAYEMAWLGRRLRGLRKVREALREGLITKTHAKAIATLDPELEFEEAWIKHAETTTVKFLQEDVERAMRMRKKRRDLYDLTGGVPDQDEWEDEVEGGDSSEACSGNGGAEGSAASSPTCDGTEGSTPAEGSADSSQACDGTDGSTPAEDSADSSQACAATEGSTPAEGPADSSQTCAGTEGATEAEGSADSSQTCAGTEAATPVEGTADSSQTRVDSKRVSSAMFKEPTFIQRVQKILRSYEKGSDEPDGPLVTFRFWLPADHEEQFHLAMCISEKMFGGITSTGEMLEVVADAFIQEYGPVALEEAKKHPIFERDEWYCVFPNCTIRIHLEDHHFKFRSRGGCNAPWNRGCTCHGHHHRCIHAGWVVVTGRAPDRLTWLMGVGQGPNGLPHMTIRGRRIVQQAA